MPATAQPRDAWRSDELRRHLLEGCGVAPGDVLIVHSSLKSIGWVVGGPEALVQALQAVVTGAGALLMPVFSAPTADGVFRVDRTPSRVGLVTETFRTMPGVVRSLHPTHSVAAWGGRARALTAGHHRTSGLGVGSPFHQAARCGADVLMIGCDLTRCSLIHVAEAVVRVPYLGKVCYQAYDRPLTVVDAAGRRTVVPPRDVPTDSAGFTVVADALDRRGWLARCRLGSAECLKFPAGECLDVAVELLGADAAALLCHNPACPVCVPARRIVEEARGAVRGGPEQEGGA